MNSIFFVCDSVIQDKTITLIELLYGMRNNLISAYRNSVYNWRKSLIRDIYLIHRIASTSGFHYAM